MMRHIKILNIRICIIVLLAITACACATKGHEPRPLSEIGKELRAGLRASPYGPRTPFPEPSYWRKSGESMASRFRNSVPAVIWIVSTMEATDENVHSDTFASRTKLNMPPSGTAYENIIFNKADKNEEYIDLFDRAGFRVWLQVEPAQADVVTLIDLVMKRYSSHPSVIGFGIDVEWYKWSKDVNPEGAGVSDAEARLWSERVRSYNPYYRLFLKHWLVSKMPPTYREGIVFLDDSQEFRTLDEMVAEFQLWGKAFAPSPVGFQFGYPADRAWWQKLKNPPRDIGKSILEKISNTSDLYWVDFSLKQIWPY